MPTPPNKLSPLNVVEALDYQREHYGRIVYGRDALYALARTGTVPVVRNGRRRLFFPVSTLDALLTGLLQENRDVR